MPPRRQRLRRRKQVMERVSSPELAIHRTPPVAVGRGFVTMNCIPLTKFLAA